MSRDEQSAAESREAARRIAQREALSLDPLGPLVRGRHDFTLYPERPAELINCVREPFKEFERMFPKEVPVVPDPKITVSIPIVIGGYTGQRDAWEQNTYDMAVTIDGDNVILTQGRGVPGRKVTIPWSTLQKAVALVNPPPPSGPVYRDPVDRQCP